jgi:hypothetical protein
MWSLAWLNNEGRRWSQQLSRASQNRRQKEK